MYVHNFFKSFRIVKNMDLSKINDVNNLVEILPVKKMKELNLNENYKVKALKLIST